MTALRYIPIADIHRRRDARPLDDSIVMALTESIREIGLRTPINVRVVGNEYELIAGSHRLAACERLGESEILVYQSVDDDLHAELGMIDENLCRAELSIIDRARQTARRKAIYELLHPEKSHGGDRRRDQVANLATCSFTAETAAATGQSERAVRRDAERGEKIVPDALSMMKGTELATGTYLDSIKDLPPADQLATVLRDLDRRSPVNGPIPLGLGSHKTASRRAGKPTTASYSDFVRYIDPIAEVDAAAIIKDCPPRERAALCSKLVHLGSMFEQITEALAP